MATDAISNGQSPVTTEEDVSSRLQEPEDVVDVSEVKEASKSNGKDSGPGKAGDGPVPPQSNRSKKKEDKSIEHILKALSSLEKPEEKLAALCKKYADILEEHRVLQSWSKQSQKKHTMVMREKDQLQTEHSKAILAKSKLESLCRELQRHNKLVKEESLARAREEEDKRKEVTTKFQTTLAEIQQQMTENSATNIKLREEKAELVGKIKTLIEKYELREQHFDKVLKHKDIEQQLAEAKLAQAELLQNELKETFEKEKQVLMLEAGAAQQKIMVLMEQEKQLRSQVALYTDKYEEFQDTLKKSSDVFSSFKSETEQMTKKIKKLEKETNMWRTRWENSNKALLEMAEDKTKSVQDIARLNAKIVKLESLCRALQHRNANKESEESSSLESPVEEGHRTTPLLVASTVASSTSEENDNSSSGHGGVSKPSDSEADGDENSSSGHGGVSKPGDSEADGDYNSSSGPGGVSKPGDSEADGDYNSSSGNGGVSKPGDSEAGGDDNLSSGDGAVNSEADRTPASEEATNRVTESKNKGTEEFGFEPAPRYERELRQTDLTRREEAS